MKLLVTASLDIKESLCKQLDKIQVESVVPFNFSVMSRVIGKDTILWHEFDGSESETVTDTETDVI